jgi:hypothetical protein
MIAARNSQLDREFRYAVVGLSIAGTLALSALGAFVYLVMEGHEKAAGALFGAAISGLIAGFRRSRLNDVEVPSNAQARVEVEQP